MAGASEFTNIARLGWHRRGFFAGQTAYVTLAFIIICVLAALFSRNFATTGNLLNFRNFSYIALMSLGMTVVIITGGIDLSVGSVCALVAVCSMIVMRGVARGGPLRHRRGNDHRWPVTVGRHRVYQRPVDRCAGAVPVRHDARDAVDLSRPDICNYPRPRPGTVRTGCRNLLRSDKWSFCRSACAGRLRAGGRSGARTRPAPHHLGPPSIRGRLQRASRSADRGARK
jgi:hypothetical protein